MTKAEVRERIRKLINQATGHVATGRLEAAGRAIEEAERLSIEFDAGHDLVNAAMTGVGEYLAMVGHARERQT